MKLGIVLEGGASRTFFTCGVLDALMDAGIEADYLTGTSAGIANGISFLSRQRGRSQFVGETYMNDPRYMGRDHLFDRDNHSLYNLKFVFDEIPNRLVPFDYDALRANPCRGYACVTNLRTAKPEFLPLTGDDPTWQTLIATCALPILFRPVEIDGEVYMDGGITDPVPYDAAIAAGCDKILVILTRPRGFVKPFEKSLLLAACRYRHYPAFRRALLHRTGLYNRQREEMRRLEAEGRLFVICPEEISLGRTERSAEVLHRIYEDGLRICEERLPALRAYLEDAT